MNTTKKYIKSFKRLSVNDPSVSQKITLNILIFFGFVSLVFFVIWLIQNLSIGHPIFYWLLLIALVFRITRVLIQWIHYLYIANNSDTKVLDVAPAVDVLTTYFPGEPIEMVKNTLLAMKNIEYPHEDYLCDEADDPELKAFCQMQGIHHISRDNLKDAKAGNINNALKAAKGEFCFILDPDHVPHKDLLGRIIPKFNSEDIGFVQIVQGYYNHDKSIIAKAAAQQTYQFYGPMMMGMNQLGTVQALGANCCFRRKALDSIGGHAAGLAEDLHTSMLLHANGWRSLYLPEVLTRGRVPEDYPGYFKQQLKWSKGSFDLFLNAFPNTFTKLSINQKIHYFLQPQYYLLGIVGLIEILVPIFSLLFFFTPWKINFLGFLVAVTPLILIAVLIQNYVQNWVLDETERGFHFVGGLVRNATWFIYLTGFFFSILQVNLKYLPTPKENYSGSQFLYILPNLTVALISLFAIIYGLSHDLTPYSLFMAGFALLNFLMFGISSLLAAPSINFKTRKQTDSGFLNSILPFVKNKMWILRHFLYRIAREHIIPLSIILISVLFIFFLTSKTGNNKEIQNKETGDYFMISSQYDLDYKNTDYLSVDIINPDTLLMKQFLNTNKDLFINFSQCIDNVINYDQLSTEIHNSQLNSIAKILKNKENNLFITFDFNSYIKLSGDLLNAKEMKVLQASVWDHLINIFNQQNCLNIIWVWSIYQDYNHQLIIPNNIYWDLGLMRVKGSSDNIYLLLNKFKEISTGKPLLFDVSATDLQSLNSIEFKKALNELSFSGIVINDSIPMMPNVLKMAPLKAQKISIHFNDYYNIKEIDFQPDTIKGIFYQPFDIYTMENSILSKTQLDQDFKKIRSMGANFVRTYTTDIYFQNIKKAAKENQLSIMSGINIPGNIDFNTDKKRVDKLRDDILSKVKSNFNVQTVKFWDFGDNVFGQIEEHYAKPYSDKVKKSYLRFLGTIVDEVIKIAPNVHTIFSVPFTYQNFDFIIKNKELIHPNLFIGFNVFYKEHFEFLKKTLYDQNLKSRVIITGFGPEGYWDSKLTKRTIYNLPIESDDFEKANDYLDKWGNYLLDENLAIKGGFVYRWKEHPHDRLTWMGITTILETEKPSYVAIKNLWQSQQEQIQREAKNQYRIVYNGKRIAPYITRPTFYLINNYTFDNTSNSRIIQWVLSGNSDSGSLIKMYGNESYIRIDDFLANGEYSMHVYLTDLSNITSSISAPFVIY